MPPSNPTPKPLRLSREESQRLTRARLLAVGRDHLLKHGLSGTVADRVAEEAGYTRGAFYSNFSSKEELFAAVMEEEHQRYSEIYREIFSTDRPSETMLQELRANYIDMLVNPEWVILWADFQSEAVRSPEMQERYRLLYDYMVADSIERLTEHVTNGKLVCKVSPSHFVLAMSSFAHGLAMRQHVLGAHLGEQTTRNLIGEMFDILIQTPPIATSLD